MTQNHGAKYGTGFPPLLVTAFFGSSRHVAVQILMNAMQNNGGLRLLLIDNVAAFYWLDRDCKSRHAGAGQQLNNA